MKAILHILHTLVFEKCPVVLQTWLVQGQQGGSYSQCQSVGKNTISVTHGTGYTTQTQ